MTRYRIIEEDDSLFHLPFVDIVLTIFLIILFPIGIIYLIVKACNHARDRKYHNAMMSSQATEDTVGSIASLAAARENGWLKPKDFDKLKNKRVRKLKRL